MKKKFGILLAFVCVLCCTFLFAACGTNEADVVEVTEITLNKTQITLTEGEEETLIATLTPSNATDQTMEWSSLDTSVATVEYGSVIAVAEGETTVTVSSGNGKTATCLVTVKAKEEEIEPPVQYTVKLDANGGKFDDNNAMFTMTVDEGGKLTNVTATRGDKYVFIGWYTDEYRTYMWDIDNDTVTDDVTLYAGWKYLNSYQTVIDALSARIKAERQDGGAVEILSVFTDNGCLCFVEKDSTGVFSYKTEICNFDRIIDNAELISQIPNTNLTQIKAYNYLYTSDNNSFIADCMAWKYTSAANSNEAIIYSCVSEWEEDIGHITNGGPYYSCEVKAIFADENGRVFDCSFTVVAGYANFNAVIGGNALSQEYDVIITQLGEHANDFYSEYLKEVEA